MSRVLRGIITQTGRERPTDAAFVTSHYTANSDRIRCTVAIDETRSDVGFQSLKRAQAGNPYDVPEGWGIIGLCRQDVETLLRSGLFQLDEAPFPDESG